MCFPLVSKTLRPRKPGILFVVSENNSARFAICSEV